MDKKIFLTVFLLMLSGCQSNTFINSSTSGTENLTRSDMTLLTFYIRNHIFYRSEEFSEAHADYNRIYIETKKLYENENDQNFVEVMAHFEALAALKDKDLYTPVEIESFNNDTFFYFNALIVFEGTVTTVPGGLLVISDENNNTVDFNLSDLDNEKNLERAKELIEDIELGDNVTVYSHLGFRHSNSSSLTNIPIMIEKH